MATNSLKVRNSLTLKPTTTPSSPENGDIYYDSGTNNFQFYQNGSFIVLNNIANNSITNALLSQMPTLTIKGNNTGGTANAADLTVAQVNAILPIFTSSLNGLVPASGGGTSNFLRADGTWTAVGTGSVTTVSVVSANGFAGTVANAGTTPAITISTTITGILQGNGTGVTAANTSGTGNIVLVTNATLVTPALGTPTALVGTNITGTATGFTVGTANNLSGGTGGSLPYQSAASTTAMLANGTSGQVLTSSGGTSAPTWSSPSATAPTFSATAGEALTAGMAAYISVGNTLGDTGRTAGQLYKVDPTNQYRINWSGIVQSSVSGGASATIYYDSRATGYSGLNPGQTVYSDPASPGNFTQTVPSTATYFVLPVGIADTATSFVMNGAGGASALYIDSVPSGAPTVTGTRASPSNIVAGTGVAFTGSLINNIWFIQGNGGATTVTANPQIAVGSYLGQELRLINRSATNTVTFSNGTGLSLNGGATMGLDDALSLLWDGTNWVETARTF